MADLDVEVAGHELQALSAEEVVKWAAATFGSRVAVACSFGAEDVVLVDMLSRATSQPRVFAIDTGRLHEETYEVMERIRERYGLEIEVYFPQRDAVEQLERSAGFYSFRKSLEARHACCKIRKVEPLNRALSGLDGWMTGLRREQSVTRTSVQVIERDDGHGGIIKINPLADWTSEQVWDYIRRHDVPYNRLHDQAYPSIGCAPCTRAIQPGEHPRAGRWWWENPEHKECGLHTQQRRRGLTART
jgi:phosphoadenosine phosphosulfate reductase